MPKYRITDPETKKTVRLTGDSPPTEQELTEIFEGIQGTPQAPVSIEPSPIQQENIGWMKTIASGLKNLPEGLWDYGVETVKALTIDLPKTLEGTAHLIAGTIEKAIPGEQSYEKNVDAMVDYYKEKYGSIENLKKTIAENPEEILTDASTFVIPGGAAVKGVGVATKAKPIIQAGSKMTKAGAMMEPLNIAKGAVTLPLKLMPEKVPIALYQSATKFNTTLSSKQRMAVTKTALKAQHQIAPTIKGMERLRDLIDSYNVEVARSIERASKTAEPFRFGKLYSGLNKLQRAAEFTADEPGKVAAAFKATRKQIEKGLEKSQFRTPQQVQKIKQNIYKELQSFYEKQKAAPTRVKIRKLIAKNAKEMLESIAPEIKRLNKNEGALIDLWEAVERKANRVSNRDLIGIGLPLKTGAGAGVGYMIGGEVGGSIAGSIGLILGIIDSPQIKAKLALTMARVKEAGIKINPTTAGIRLGFYKMREIKEAQEREEEPRRALPGSRIRLTR